MPTSSTSFRGTVGKVADGNRLVAVVSGHCNSHASLYLPISNFERRAWNFSRGGIAQLVERQLCKLEVRGSNPLASKEKLKR